MWCHHDEYIKWNLWWPRPSRLRSSIAACSYGGWRPAVGSSQTALPPSLLSAACVCFTKPVYGRSVMTSHILIAQIRREHSCADKCSVLLAALIQSSLRTQLRSLLLMSGYGAGAHSALLTGEEQQRVRWVSEPPRRTRVWDSSRHGCAAGPHRSVFTAVQLLAAPYHHHHHHF